MREFHSFNLNTVTEEKKEHKSHKRFCGSVNTSDPLNDKFERAKRSLSNSLIASMISIKASAIFKLDMRKRRQSTDAKLYRNNVNDVKYVRMNNYYKHKNDFYMFKMKGMHKKSKEKDEIINNIHHNNDGAYSDSDSLDDIEGDMQNAKQVFSNLDSIYTSYDKK